MDFATLTHRNPHSLKIVGTRKIPDLSKKPAKMSKVNLDSLIPKDDFIAQTLTPAKKSKLTNLTLSHLLPNSDHNYASLAHLLRKPDFQRETNEWDKRRICDLIECFIKRDFIPSIILWESPDNNHIYVIDGAHRISAILAYINDDYGDKDISHKFYGYNKIPQAELDLAEETREYINEKIGSFEMIMKENGDLAAGIKNAAFDLQVIEGAVKRAEDSFFKINQQGVVLSPTEKALCKYRDRPSCIATRVIMRGIGGSQYWKNFEAKNQTGIKEIGEELNKLLFEPPYNDDSLSVILHHPLAGTITSATPMILDFMKIIAANHTKIKDVDDKTDGSEALLFLELARKIVWKILSKAPGSLGLFPSVYFYSSGGKYIQSSFLGMIQLLLENDNNESFLPRFTKVRSKIENFLITYKVYITQINKKFGSKQRSYRHMKGFFVYLIDQFNTEISENDLLADIHKRYDYLNERESDIEKPKSKRFSKEQKIFLGNKEELLAQPKCKICTGILHPQSKDYDHKQDLKHGGGSEDKNARTTHYYCNNSKDLLIKLGIYKEPANV